jgi:formylmethanofuran dehydrogenase subunit D
MLRGNAPIVIRLHLPFVSFPGFCHPEGGISDGTALVMEATDYSRQPTPMLRIRGLWLQELGFVAGDSVLVHCEDGKIIVTKETVLGETE